jgi:hypothetical protein
MDAGRWPLFILAAAGMDAVFDPVSTPSGSATTRRLA